MRGDFAECGVPVYSGNCSERSSEVSQTEKPMHRIFVDLEMHPVSDDFPDRKNIFRFETIEIGAVMLNEQHEEISSFCEFVKPMYSKEILPRYSELTGITTQMLENASHFPEVLERFVQWCAGDCIVYSWSKTDLAQVKGECKQKGIEISPELNAMFRGWRDFQKEFSRLVGFHRGINLQDAVNLGGLDFDGRAHDGLVDARNTANLFRQTRDEKMFSKLKDLLVEKDNPLTFTMGDVFRIHLPE